MIGDFPIDPMHLVYFGVVWRMLIALTRDSRYKLSPPKITRLNLTLKT